MSAKELSQKARAFALAYIRLGAGQAAAIEAGYSAKCAKVTASKMLCDPRVRAIIEKHGNEAAQKAELDAAYVLGRLRSIADCGEAKHGDQLKALELLGKYLKLFTERVEHSGSVSIQVVDPYAVPSEGGDGH